METLIRTVKSIGHPVLYDLGAAGVLMQHLASDPPVKFQHLFSVTVFYVVHKPWRPNIPGHQRSLSIIHFFSPHSILVESNQKVYKSPDPPPPLRERCSRTHNNPCILQWIVASNNVARFLAVATKVRVHLFSWGVSRGGGRQIAELCGAAIWPTASSCWSLPGVASGSTRGGQRGYQLLPTQSKYNMQHAFQWLTQVTW